MNSIIPDQHLPHEHTELGSLAELNMNKDLTPVELASFYENLIRKAGRHSAAFILATSK